jgi:uncharacterized protein YjbI with pentapeptide repeats
MGDVPEPRPRPAEAELREALAAHRRWVDSGGREGARANLSGADLAGANLEGECLASARLSGASLARANLVGADLSGAYLDGADLGQAALNVCNLANARLSGADLAGAELCHAVLNGADLGHANLADADLAHASLIDADLHRAVLTGADLHRADLTRAGLNGADLRGADLTRANLSGADLRHAELTGARLPAAALAGADLRGARLVRADLSQADLSGAQLGQADLTRARLKGARLENADLRTSRVARLDKSYVRGAQFSALSARWWFFLCTAVFRPLAGWLDRRGWKRAATAVGFTTEYNDPWSILRQSYAGPRVLFLFFTVMLFVLPYAGRASLFSAVGPLEREGVQWLELRKKQVEARLATAPHELELAEEREWLDHVLRRAERKPIWQVLLKWGQGNPWPVVLAAALILYNIGLYVLITCVSSLRDEEERSGWTPAWREYGYLIWVHRVVVVLFYVSFGAFVINVLDLLGEEVIIPRLR